MDIDPRVHRRLIGLRGKNIRRIMDEFKVDIRFPNSNSRQGEDSIVVITGDEDNVLDAKDHLLNLAEEYVSTQHIILKNVMAHNKMKNIAIGHVFLHA